MMLNLTLLRVLILLVISTLCNTLRYECDKRTVPCGCGQTSVGINARVVNGEDAIPSSWPMVVSLRASFEPSDHFCGGTILTESYILTAAHCFDYFSSNTLLNGLTIAAGIHNLSQSDQINRRIDKVIIHPLWIQVTDEIPYDIAIVHLTEPLDLDINSSISRTCLPPRSNTSEELIQYPSNGTSLVVIGWGQLGTLDPHPDTLQQATVRSIHHLDKICASMIHDPSIHFCAGLHEGGKGACYGDSGGPILKWIGNRWEQVGIVSYGEMGCATKGYPAVFTRISYFHDWIESHIYSNNQTTISINKTNHRIAYGCSNYSVQCDCGRRKVLLSPSTIVKSENALPYSWSMIVSIRVGISSQHICSGTILESSYILTAAHCLANRSPQDITIKAGIHYRSDTNAIIRQVDHIYIHPNYTAQSNVYKHDIAILHLSQPLDTVNDAYIARTCRSLTSNQLIYETRYPSNGTQLVISGWDIINMSNASTSDSLQQAEVYAIEGNNANCFLSDDQRQLQFCAGRYGSDKEICYGGDSGSPIFERYSNQWVQVGLASNCRMSSGLGVFTKLATYSRWIRSVLNPNITESVHVYGCDKKAPCGCGQTDVTLTSSRILDGEYAITHSWPMMVSIQRYNKHQCGGTILSDSFVLTAAECLSSYEDSNITITAGIHRLSETVIVKRNIDRIYFHPNYTRVRPYLHDIAIVHLAQPLPLGNISWTFAKTCVPITNEAPSGQYPVPNSQLVVIGWGNSRLIGETSDVLRQIPVRVINNDHRSCSSSLVNSTYQFCAESSNIAESTNDGYLCYGDSGGPVLMYKNNHWEQVGIVPYHDGCGSSGQSELFVRLLPYIEWMKNVTNSSLTTYSPSSIITSTCNQQRNDLIFTTLFLLITIFL